MNHSRALDPIIYTTHQLQRDISHSSAITIVAFGEHMNHSRSLDLIMLLYLSTFRFRTLAKTATNYVPSGHLYVRILPA